MKRTIANRIVFFFLGAAWFCVSTAVLLMLLEPIVWAWEQRNLIVLLLCVGVAICFAGLNVGSLFLAIFGPPKMKCPPNPSTEN